MDQLLNKLRQRRLASVITAIAILATLLVVVTREDGYHSSHYELHDSGIWMTRLGNNEGTPFGRLNAQLASIDMTPYDDRSVFNEQTTELAQNDANVVVFTKTRMAELNVPRAQIPTAVTIPANSDVQIGGDVGAVLDPSGKVWVAPASQVGTLALGADSATPPTLKTGPTSKMAVGTDGVTHVYDPQTGEFRAVRNGRVAIHRVSARTSSNITITAVGKRAVVLDDEQHKLLFDNGKTVDLDGSFDGAKLQQASDPGDAVLLESRKGLWIVPFSGGPPERQATANGQPVAPVALLGCYYGAWQTNDHVLQVCPARTPPSSTTTFRSDGHALAWRVNHQRVVLNDTANGGGLLFDGNRALTIAPSDWKRAFTTKQSKTGPGPADPSACKDAQAPSPPKDPIAAGARPGRAAVINVVSHFKNPGTCHVLAVTDVRQIQPTNGTATIAAGGQSVVYVPPPGVDTATLEYTVSNGVSPPTTGGIAVRVAADSENGPPQATADFVTAQAGTTAVVNVLANDTDPQSDPLRLESVATAAGNTADGVNFGADGNLRVAVPTTATGTLSLKYTVADDRAAKRSDTAITIRVTREAQPPRPTADYASTTLDNAGDASAGKPARDLVVDLLANDLPGSGTTLILTGVAPFKNSLAKTWFTPDGKFYFTPAGTPASLTTTYTVSDGVRNATGQLRIDLQPGQRNRPPDPTPDVAQLRSDGSATVDVLLNDTDPDGDLLAVTDAQLGAGMPANIRVQLVEHALLRVSTAGSLNQPVRVGYTVTDGRANHEGHSFVTILPRPLANEDQAPIAHPDVVTVRAGGSADIPVLANDADPDGDPLAILPNSVVPSTGRVRDASDGEWFVHGDRVRYKAPPTAGLTVELRYVATDHTAQSATTITIKVIGVGAGQPESAPMPRPLFVRVRAGYDTGPVSIPIVGIDAENDPVAVTGLGTGAPQLGTITDFHGREFNYRAGEVGGTDEFQYVVRDALGRENVGAVVVAVLSAATDSAPVAADDVAFAPPGHTIAVPVLANDTGDALRITGFDPKSITASLPGLHPSVDPNGPYMNVRVPPGKWNGATINFRYSIESATSRQRSLDSADVTVTVDDKAPRDRPVARDDVVAAPTTGNVARVPVLTNDTDPLYGSNLTIEPRPGYTIDPDGKQISIPLGSNMVQVMYVVHNKDQERDAAFVTVQPAADAPPQAITDNYTAKPGQEITMNVLANDRVAPKRSKLLRNAWTRDGVKPRMVGDKLVFRNNLKFGGVASVVYQLFDGKTSSSGLAVVHVTGNAQPRLSPAEIRVDPNDTATLDLTSPRITNDPDRTDSHTYKYTSLRLPPGVTCECGANGTVVVTAAPTAAKGATGTIVVTATDHPYGAESKPATLSVSVNNPAPPTINDFAVGPFRKTQVSSIQILPLAHAFGHVKGDLQVSAAGAVDDQGAHVTHDARTITYEPTARAFGDKHISFTIKDATGAESAGTATVTLFEKPTAPGAPRLVCPSGVSAQCQGSKFALDPLTNKLYLQLNWTNQLSVAQGSPVVDYEVRWNGGAPFPCGNATGLCTIYNRLKSTQTGYSFDVRAISRAGDPSDWSRTTSSGPLNLPPYPATAVSVDFDVTRPGTALLVKWAPPARAFGTDIDKYTADCVGPDGTHSASTLGRVTQTPVTGLTQGQRYQCSVRSHNSAGYAPPTAAAVVYDRPMAPPKNIQTINTSSFDSYQAFGGVYDISWPAVADYTSDESGGDSANNLRYTLSWTIVPESGAPTTGSTQLAPGVRDFPNVPAVDNATYTFSLTVDNAFTLRSGVPSVGPTSGSLYSLGFPSSQPSLSPRGTTYGNAVVDIGTNVRQSAHAGVQLQYKIFDGSTLAATTGAGTQSIALPRGQHTIAVDACYRYAGTDFCASASSQNPIAKPQVQLYVAGAASAPTNLSTPGGQTADSARLTWNWSAPADDGCNGCGIASYQVNLNGQGWQSVGNTTGYGANVGPGQYRLSVVAVNSSQGAQADTTNSVATSGVTTVTAPPRATGSISRGTAVSPNPCRSQCWWLHVTVSNLSPGSQHTVTLGESSGAPCVGGPCWGTYTRNATSSGTISFGDNFFFFGVCGAQVWVVLDGSEIPNRWTSNAC